MDDGVGGSTLCVGDGVGSTLCVGDGVESTLGVGDGGVKHIMCE